MTAQAEAGRVEGLLIYAPDTFGEAAFFGEEALRVRAASVHACASGASLVRWPVRAVETFVGFELHARCERLHHRKIVESVAVGKRKLVLGLSEHAVDVLCSPGSHCTRTVHIAPPVRVALLLAAHSDG